MAAMDRLQADALTVLAGVDTSLRLEQYRLLEEYRRQLALNVSAERYFFACVALALAGMFWFGRTLHRANERMAADRRRASEERHARLAAIGEVCATVAHGILNPLAGIRAAAEVARTESPGGELEQTLDDIVSEVSRLDVRARRLLDFSRPLEPELGRCDVLAVLAAVERSLEASRKDLEVVVTSHAPLVAQADETMLFEALAELGANGARAMRDRGCLRFDATADDGRVVIRIIDEGVGIPEAVRPRLFELFFTTRPGGTGLGLATVRKLVQIQGGTVDLESTGPAGSVFRVELPAAA
jgi:signal transduction histidine kinase